VPPPRKSVPRRPELLFPPSRPPPGVVEGSRRFHGRVNREGGRHSLQGSFIPLSSLLAACLTPSWIYLHSYTSPLQSSLLFRLCHSTRHNIHRSYSCFPHLTERLQPHHPALARLSACTSTTSTTSAFWVLASQPTSLHDLNKLALPHLNRRSNQPQW
jgi:hypothetical protein